MSQPHGASSRYERLQKALVSAGERGAMVRAGRTSTLLFTSRTPISVASVDRAAKFLLGVKVFSLLLCA